MRVTARRGGVRRRGFERLPPLDRLCELRDLGVFAVKIMPFGRSGAAGPLSWVPESEVEGVAVGAVVLDRVAVRRRLGIASGTMNLGRSLVLPLLLVVASCGPDHRVGGSLDWMTDTARGALGVGETVAVEPLPAGDQESAFTGADALDLVVVPRHRLRSLVESGWIRVRPGGPGSDEYAVPVAAALVGVSGAPQEWWEEPRTWSWLLAEERHPPVGLGRVDVRTALGVALLAVGAEPGSSHRDDLAPAVRLVTSRMEGGDGPTVTLGGEPAVETLLHELVAVVPIDASDPTWAWERVDEWTAADDVLRPGWVRPEGDDPRTWGAPVGEFARAARLWRTWDRGPSLAEVRALFSGGTDAADRARAD